MNWEGRRREFGPALDATGVLPDCRVLDTLAVEMDVDLFTQTPAAAAGELARLGRVHAASPRRARRCAPAEPLRPVVFGQAVLATWRQLLDEFVAGRRRARAGRHGPARRSCGATSRRPSAWA